MPKGNQKGGKKHKKGKKESFQEKQLIYKDPKEDQEYAKVIKVNGSGRYNLFCFDGKDRLGICAGNIKRRVRLAINDIVLVALWDFQDNKCSIVHKYEEDEVQKLKTQREFPENIKLEEDNQFLDDSENLFSYDNPSDDEGDNKEKEKEKESSSGEEDFFVDVNDI
jgi:translation initiation factor 1A